MNRSGAVLLAMGLLVPALASAQKPGNSMHTRSAEVYLGNARKASVAAEKKDNYEKALNVLLEGVDREGNNPKIWLLLGEVQAGLGNLPGADSAFDKAESLYPEYKKEIDPQRFRLWASQYNAGVAAIRAGDYDKAIGLFESADQMYRGRADALLSLASLYSTKREADKAEKAYRDALAVLRGPGSKGLNAEDAARWQEDEQVATTHLADLLASQGRNDEAAEAYRQLLAHQPDNIQARSNLAVVLSRSGKADEAAKIYDDLLKQKDLPETVLFNIGVGMYRGEAYEKASASFRRIIEKNPYANDALYNLAQTLFAWGGRLQDSLSEAPEAKQTELKAEISRIYTELGDVAQRSLTAAPNDRNTIMMLAQAHKGLGEQKGGAQAEAAKKQVLATLQKAEDLTVEVSGIQVTAGDVAVTVTGSLANLKLTPGAQVTLRFTLLDGTGSTVATKDVTVVAPEKDGKQSFTVEIPTDTAVAGWKYEVVT